MKLRWLFWPILIVSGAVLFLWSKPNPIEDPNGIPLSALQTAPKTPEERNLIWNRLSGDFGVARRPEDIQAAISAKC